MKLFRVKSKVEIVTLLKICLYYSPIYSILCFLMTIIEGLMGPFMLFSVAGFIDSVITGISLEQQYKPLFIYLGLTVMGYLYKQIEPDIRQYVYDLLLVDLRNELKQDVIEKEYNIDFLIFETAETQDLLLRVTSNLEEKIVSAIRSICTFAALTIQVVGILWAVAIYNITLVVAYVLIVIVAAYVTFKNGRIVYQEDKKIGILTRKMNYFSDILSSREATNERTLFGFSRFINKEFLRAHRFRSDYNTKVLAKETFVSTGINILISVFTVVIVLALVSPLQSGNMSVGLFTSLVGNMIELSKLISFQMSELVLDFSTHYEYAKDFNDFIKLKERKKETRENEDVEFESLEIKNLRFKYKDSEKYILDDVNLRLEKGKSYSLVGLNGAGKSTLVKIITGLYQDYEGDIYLNNKNLREYDFGELRKIYAVVSQDFAKYYISLKDNIELGEEKYGIGEVISKVGLEDLVRDLEIHEDSYLGKIYEEGVDVSGGEWQKIAIARALYRNTPFVIMDEPTASLSPSAETMLYNHFLEIANVKSLLMISHRLGATKITDEIIVLDNGKIVEKGSHMELMNNNEIYAQLFRKQSEMYD